MSEASESSFCTGKFPLVRIMMIMAMNACVMLLSIVLLLGKEQTIEWDSIEKAARRYIEYPSSDNARVLRQQIQSVRGENKSADYYSLIEYVFSNLVVLERQVAAGDREAAKLGFMLYNVSIGHNKNKLDCVMGDLARTYPRIFLEELSSSHNAILIKESGYPVCQTHLGQGGIRQMAHRYELEMRIRSLESVTAKKLRRIRDACVNEIKRCLPARADYPDIIADKKAYIAAFKDATILIFSEVEKANLICQRILEIEELQGAGSFGAVSERIIHSCGLLAEMTTARQKWGRMLDALRNPPFEYSEEYSSLRTMASLAGLLYKISTNPSFRDDKKANDVETKLIFKKNYVAIYRKFGEEYSKIAVLMPDIAKDVLLRKADRQDTLKKLR